MKRTVQIELAIVAVVLALLGISRVRINSGAPAPEARTEAATVDSRVGPGEAGPQVTDFDPVPAVSPPSRNSTGTTGSSKAGTSSVRGGSSQDPRSEEKNAEGVSSWDSETVDPPVHYIDQADDAHGHDGPPNAALSQREFDILRVDWGPVAYVNEESRGGYSTSLTLAGSARDDALYVSLGRWGRDCWLYHILIPRTTAQANAFCDSRGFISSVEGGPVTSTSTQSGGSLLSATFGNRAIFLRNLSAYTCTGRVDEPVNSCRGSLDWADSNLSYRI
jgi:hypothetical protein